MTDPRSNQDFIPDIETMDLKKLKDKSFLVAISTGNRDEHMYLPGSIRGPFSFYEMCEYSGKLWKDKQMHAKILVASKKLDEKLDFLDAKTADYVEARYNDIIMDGLLLDDADKQYTCEAGVKTVEKEDGA